MEKREGVTTQRLAKHDSKAELETQLREARSRITALGFVRPAASIEAELAGQRQHRRWSSSQGCTDATATRSRRFCTTYNQLQAELGKAKALEAEHQRLALISARLQSIRDRGGVKAIDPQLQSLSKATGYKAGEIEFGFLVLVVVMSELISAFGFYYALGHGAKKPLKEAATPLSRHVAASRPEGRPSATVLEAKSHRVVVSNPQTAELLPPPKTDDPIEVISDYAGERLRKVPGAGLTLSELHADFRAWCERQGIEAMSQRKFTDTLTEIAEAVEEIELARRDHKRVLLHAQFREAQAAA
jgi:hypothetical protein